MGRLWTRVRLVVIHFHARTHLHILLFMLQRRARSRACRYYARPHNYAALQKIPAGPIHKSSEDLCTLGFVGSDNRHLAADSAAKQFGEWRLNPTREPAHK